jgi:hypothetical protein
MRSLSASIVAVCVSVSGSVAGANAAADRDLASATTVASAHVGRRSSLQVSTSVLIFQVTDNARPAEAVVSFVAAARTAIDGEVRLTMRRAPEAEGMALTVVGGSEGILPVAVAGDVTLVARWIGGGRRNGHLRLQLRGAPGTYAIPVNLELNAP